MIVVYGIREKLGPIQARLSEIIRGCTQAIPEDERAPRFVALESDDIYYLGDRSDAYTVIEIDRIGSHDPQACKTLIETLFHEIESRLALPAVDVDIVIKEQEPYQWVRDQLLPERRRESHLRAGWFQVSRSGITKSTAACTAAERDGSSGTA